MGCGIDEADAMAKANACLSVRPTNDAEEPSQLLASPPVLPNSNMDALADSADEWPWVCTDKGRPARIDKVCGLSWPPLPARDGGDVSVRAVKSGVRVLCRLMAGVGNASAHSHQDKNIKRACQRTAVKTGQRCRQGLQSERTQRIGH